MPRSNRGVQEIKTLSSILGSGTHSNERHVHQFQLASLELERTRRTREKAAAMRRVADIDARMVEIDALIHKHQEALGLSNDNGSDAVRPAVRGAETPADPKRRVIRY